MEHETVTSRKTVCVYCGSNNGILGDYREAAFALAREVAARGFGIVYGGGEKGLMGAIAAAALEAEIPLTGVVPSRFRSDRSSPPEGARYLFVDTMQERKAMMRDLSDGFIALPGGIGTIDEVAETLMLRSLGFHAKPLALLDIGGFFGSFVRMMDESVEAGFMKASLRDSLIVCPDPADLVGLLAGSMDKGCA